MQFLSSGAADCMTTGTAFIYDAGSATVLQALSAAAPASQSIAWSESAASGSAAYGTRIQSTTAPNNEKLNWWIRNTANTTLVSHDTAPLAAPDAVDGTFHIVAHTDTGSEVNAHVDGVAGSTPRTYTRSTTTVTRLTVPGYQTSTLPLGMNLYEMVAFSGTSSTVREKCEGYLAHRHGQTSVLDSGHPYKTTAPTP
jgi:hypothetical protein